MQCQIQEKRGSQGSSSLYQLIQSENLCQRHFPGEFLQISSVLEPRSAAFSQVDPYVELCGAAVGEEPWGLPWARQGAGQTGVPERLAFSIFLFSPSVKWDQESSYLTDGGVTLSLDLDFFFQWTVTTVYPPRSLQLSNPHVY